MNAAEVMHRAQVSGVQLQAINGKLRFRGKPDAVQAILPDLKACKPELLRLLQAGDSDLPAVVRQRLKEGCRRLNIDSAPVLRQLDLWRYREHELREILTWPEATLYRHCELLNEEARAGFHPYPTKKDTSK